MTTASQIIPALTLEVMVSRKEGQYYDVKSAQKKPSELSDIVSAYANAEGGTVVRRTAVSLCRNTAMSSWTSPTMPGIGRADHP